MEPENIQILGREYGVFTTSIIIKWVELPQHEVIDIFKQLMKFKNLYKLSIIGCGITNLPDDISKLKDLTSLNLNCNSLKFLPESLCLLENLEHLTVINNHLEKIPDNIGNMKKLRHIYFANNKIRSIPLSIINLPNLKSVNLQTNFIGDIDSSISKFFEDNKIEANMLGNIDGATRRRIQFIPFTCEYLKPL